MRRGVSGHGFAMDRKPSGARLTAGSSHAGNGAATEVRVIKTNLTKRYQDMPDSLAGNCGNEGRA